MLDPVLEAFGVRPDFDLDLMQPGQTLCGITARILAGIETVLNSERPHLVVVQGDTNTTFAAALGAFYRGVPVAHVEAGLRTGDMRQPFPEEMNRVLTSRIAEFHFAPTRGAEAALLREGVAPEKIFVTGNTGIDAVLWVRHALERGELVAPAWPWLDPARRLVLVTCHRRENFGPGFDRAMRALALVAERPDVQVVYPVHRNPNVLGPAHSQLSGHANIVLLDPLPYVAFVDLMRRCWMIDYGFGRHSGGSAVARQAGPGAARENRAAGSGGSRNGEAGGNRRAADRRRGNAIAGRRGRIHPHDARPQPLRRRARLRTDRPGAGYRLCDCRRPRLGTSACCFAASIVWATT
jgi:UDP-N-acetylglucosamine 2-epimerase